MERVYIGDGDFIEVPKERQVYIGPNDNQNFHDLCLRDCETNEIIYNPQCIYESDFRKMAYAESLIKRWIIVKDFVRK